MRRTVNGGMACIVAALPGLVVAAQAPDAEEGFRYSVSAGAIYTDNAGRSHTNQESETSAELGVNAMLRHERERQTASLAADLQFQSHSYGTYADGVVGGATASAGYRLFRDALTWTIDDEFGKALIESHSLATPDNTQNLNVLSTGPDIRLPLGPRTGVLVQGRWTDVSYEKSSYGNRRLSGVLG